MEKDLHKRLEEAAKEYAWSVWANPMFLQEWDECKRGFIAGAKLGYKEAVAMAKEWLKWNAQPKYIYFDEGQPWIDNAQLVADFETDMNKLWEK